MTSINDLKASRRAAARLLSPSLAVVILLAGIQTAPPLINRYRHLQTIAAQNEALRRRPPGDPTKPRISERDLREKLRRPEPGRPVIELNESPRRRD